MFDSSLGFSLLISTIVTVIMYVATRSKNKSEQEQKDKQNDMIILCGFGVGLTCSIMLLKVYE